MRQSVIYVGLDVHKDTIAVAVAVAVAVEEDGKRAQVGEHGEIANTPAALTNLLGKLGGPDVELYICYEAGPCGNGIQRQVTTFGHKIVPWLPHRCFASLSRILIVRNAVRSRPPPPTGRSSVPRNVAKLAARQP